MPTARQIRRTGEPVPAGVYLRLHRAEPGKRPTTHLIDMHPRAEEKDHGYDEDAALSAGQTFLDPVAGVAITNLFGDSRQARIRFAPYSP